MRRDLHQRPEPVCRHAQYTTTDILATPLASTCVAPFSAADGDTPAGAECRVRDHGAEYRTLTPKMDAADRSATTVEAYLGGTDWRTDLYSAEPPRS